MCREMKDSGIEWIGEINNEWSIVKIAKLAQFINGYAFNGEDLTIENEIPVIRIGDIQEGGVNLEGCLKYKEDKRLYNYSIQSKDVLIAMSGATTGKTAFINEVDSVAYINQRVGIIRNSKYSKYINYSLNTGEFKKYIDLLADGSAQPNISTKGIMNYYLALPNRGLDNIINYLDRKVSQINNVISKQKSLIEKYKAYKQSLITETVTKGLNKNVPMKDSAIEWIGEIPSHWSKEKIKYLVQISRGRFNHRPRNDVRFYNGEYPFIQTGDVARANKYINTYEQTLNKKGFEVSKEFKKGTIVMTIAANIGDIAILNFDSCAPDSIVGFEPIGYSHWNYIYYLFIAAKPAFFETSIISTQLNLNIELIKELFVVRPPMEEQKQIAEFLDKKCIAIDSIISKKEELIEKLERYKKSLIYECVTGKRAVN